jgi:hypothetical protein
VRDIDTAVADSLKVLDPNRPIREADMRRSPCGVGFFLCTGSRRGHPILDVVQL